MLEQENQRHQFKESETANFVKEENLSIPVSLENQDDFGFEADEGELEPAVINFDLLAP